MGHGKIIAIVFLLMPVFFAAHAEKGVGLAHVQFADKTRHGRNMVLEVWYPSTLTKKKALKNSGFWKRLKIERHQLLGKGGETYPLIVFSHEHGGSRFSSSWFAEGMAGRGYIVAILDHFGDTYYNPVLEYAFSALWHRPLDISRTLDYLLEKSPWKDHIDTRKIAVAGYELGSLSVLWTIGAEADLKALRRASDAFADISAQPHYLADRLRRADWGEARADFQDERISAGLIFAPLFLSAFDISNSKPLLFLTVNGREGKPSLLQSKQTDQRYRHVRFIHFEDLPMEIFLNQCSTLGCSIYPKLCRKIESEKPRIQGIALNLCDDFLKQTWSAEEKEFIPPDGEW